MIESIVLGLVESEIYTRCEIGMRDDDSKPNVEISQDYRNFA